MGRSDIGLTCLGSSLVPFLYRDFSFAKLQSFGKLDNLMDIL